MEDIDTECDFSDFIKTLIAKLNYVRGNTDKIESYISKFGYEINYDECYDELADSFFSKFISFIKCELLFLINGRQEEFFALKEELKNYEEYIKNLKEK